MAETDYATVPELRDFLRIRGEENDVDLETAIVAASRAIEELTNRVSFLTPTSTTARVYTSHSPTVLRIDEAIEDGSFAVTLDLDRDGTFSTAWTPGTEFETFPLNHVLDGRPVTSLRTRPGWTFPTTYGPIPTVKITALHGFPSLPPQVKRACLIYSGRLYRRGYSVDGVIQGFDEPVRISSRTDPDVETLLGPFVRNPVKVG